MTYATILADPPWAFGDRLPGPSRGAAKNYSCLTVPEIVLEIHQFELAEDARLFLWRVASMQQEALDVIRQLGFTLKTEIVWRKTTLSGKPWFGMGRTVRASHETCLVAVRGRPPVLNHSTRSVFDAPVRAHSQKPEEFYGLIESLSPGPYLECFARAYRPGWASHGLELPVDVPAAAAL